MAADAASTVRDAVPTVGGGPSGSELAVGEPTPATVTARGKRLGRYELLFELARGGMGTVYAARLTGPHDFDRIVAVKQLSGEIDGENRAALLDEARLGARIRHPNVVQVYELGSAEGEPFVAMELIEGVSLAQLLQRLTARDERLDVELAAWLIERVALGLHAAHELCNADGQPAELVHRDISPDNILLSYDGRVCVSDFGVARFSGNRQTTERGVIKGKFAYMSPEQTRAEPLDRRSDLFALGAVLYESLSGSRLFDSPSAADTIRRVGSQPIADLSADDERVPASLAAIALHCLQRDIAARPTDAREVAGALRQARRALPKDIDDSDLVTLLARLFNAERATLAARLSLDPAAPASAVQALAQADVTPAALGQASTVAASVVARRPPTRARGWLLAAALGALLVATVVLWPRPEQNDGGASQSTASPAPDQQAHAPQTAQTTSPMPSAAQPATTASGSTYSPHGSTSASGAVGSQLPAHSAAPAPKTGASPQPVSASSLTPRHPAAPHTSKPHATTSGQPQPSAAPTAPASAGRHGGVPFGTL